MMTIIPKIVSIIYLIAFHTIVFVSALLLSFATAIYIGVDFSQILKNYNIQNTRFFIQFQKKLTIEIYDLKLDEIQIEDNNESSETPNPKDILKYIQLFKSSVEKIDIRNLTVPEYFSGDILYRKSKLKVRYFNYKLWANIFVENNFLQLSIKKAILPKEKIELNGNIIFNSDNNETDLVSNIFLADEVNLSIFSKVENFNKISVFANSDKIFSLKPIFDILKLPKSAYIWGIDRTKFKYIKLDSVFTKFNIENPNLALENLQVQGHIRSLKSHFEPKLEPIQSSNVKFLISNSNLYLNLESLKFGKNFIQNSIEIKNLYSKPHLFVLASTKLKIDKSLKKAIQFYGKIEKIPVAISSKLATNFYMKMKLYDDLFMQFLADVNMKNRNPISKKLPNVNGGKIQFRYPKNLLKVEDLLFSYQDLTDGKISGYFNIPRNYMKFNVKLNKVFLDENSSMESRNLNIFTYGNIKKNISAQISPTDWRFANNRVQLSQFFVNFDFKSVQIQKLKAKVPDYNLTLNLDGKYNIPENNVNADLEILRLKFSELNISKEKLKVFVDLNDGVFVEVPKLLTKVEVKNSTKINFGDVGVFNKFLPITNRYPKIAGDVNVEIAKEIVFDGHLKLNQRVIKLNNRFVNDFNFSGKLENEALEISINDKIFVDKNETINIFLTDYDFNISGLSDFIDMNSSDEVDENKSDEPIKIDIQPEINIYTKKNSVFLTDNGNIFASKSIFLTAKGNKIYLRTYLEPAGKIEIETEDMRYILKASNISGKFVTNIAQIDSLVGGHYNLYVKGVEQDLDGILQLKKLKIMNLQLVNNILAFINTVPALLTFSRPGFNNNGLWILAGYVKFKKIGEIIFLEDIKIKGQSVDISGKGKINLKTQKIDMKIEISAIKYIDKAIENIPIVSYLVLGDNGSIATTINIRGDLTDPQISSDIHKDILYAPVELTKRVYNLPSKVLDFFKMVNLTDNQNQENIKNFFGY